jgi:hypothetical protein
MVYHLLPIVAMVAPILVLYKIKSALSQAQSKDQMDTHISAYNAVSSVFHSKSM